MKTIAKAGVQVKKKAGIHDPLDREVEAEADMGWKRGRDKDSGRSRDVGRRTSRGNSMS